MSTFLFLLVVKVFDRCKSTDDCLWRGAVTKEQIEALEPALPLREPETSPKSVGRVGFLNLLSKDAVSLTAGV